ncbi:hypothetical protein AB0K00_03770 [Dactylosporangium sp. NPDC049525]|uniref:hypothetical protein n=1 Tax=Dactylosporangium sp. NPDC049525 TaxID=3154730 RepID=UPI003435372B
MPTGLGLEVALTLGSADATPPETDADADGATDRPDGSRSDGGWCSVGSVDGGAPGSMTAGGPGSGGPGGGDGLPVAPASTATSSSPATVNAFTPDKTAPTARS